MSGPKQSREVGVEVLPQDFVRKLDWGSRTMIFATEAAKLTSIFQIVAEYLPSNFLAMTLWGAAYLGASAYQAIIIKNKKEKANTDEANARSLFAKNRTTRSGFREEIAIPKPVLFPNQLKKSLFPGRGLAFITKPKFS